MKFEDLSQDIQRALLAAVATTQIEGRQIGIVPIPPNSLKLKSPTTAPAPNTKQ